MYNIGTAQIQNERQCYGNRKINNYLEQKLGKILNKKFAMLFILLISAMWVISLIVKRTILLKGFLDPIALIILTILFLFLLFALQS